MEPLDQVNRQIRLEPTASAAGDARRFVSVALSEMGHADLVEDAVVIVSELTTNALIHAPNLPMWVGIWETGAFVDLEVRDCSPHPPVYLEPDYLAAGGRGLHIVKGLSIATGYTVYDCGKVVWAILRLKNPWAHGISWIQ